MRNICIQSGHWGLQTGATGAPLEQVRNVEIGKRLVGLLKALPNIGKVVQDNGITTDDAEINSTDWDLYLSLHCDADYAGNEGGGFVDWIDPSIDSSPQVNAESKRIAEAIEAVYFKDSGIRNMPNRRNANTKFYYMWNNLSAETHCVIIEMGESVDAHDRVILDDYDRQAKILVSAIQNAFPDLKPQVQPPVNPPVNVDCLAQLKAKDEEIAGILRAKELLQQQYNTLTLTLQECQKQSGIYKEEYDKANSPTGYKVQIKHLEDMKLNTDKQIAELTKQVGYWQTKFNNLKKPGLKFIQSAVIALCEKLGVEI